MRLTVNIKEQNKIAAFLNLINELEYIEIIDMEEDKVELPAEHKVLLERRLERIAKGETTFKDWDSIIGN